jgi:hypothetical protein
VPLYRDCMRELLLTMFRGWELHALSWNGKEYDRTPEECMTEATGGDELLSATILLMAYWDNDLVGIAPHYGIAFVSPDYDHTLRRRRDLQGLYDTEISEHLRHRGADGAG